MLTKIYTRINLIMDAATVCLLVCASAHSCVFVLVCYPFILSLGFLAWLATALQLYHTGNKKLCLKNVIIYMWGSNPVKGHLSVRISAASTHIGPGWWRACSFFVAFKNPVL